MSKKINYLCFSLWSCLLLSACTKTTLDKGALDGFPTAPSLNPVLNSIVKDIKNQEIVTNNLNKCPAYTSPSEQTPLSNSYGDIISTCENNKFKCYQLCLKGDGVACYFSALSLQAANYKFPAEQLFQRSCELGVASGCTNRAAGMLNFIEQLTAEQKKCIFSTFEKTCDWRDPWGCTMFADQLISEKNTKPNYKKALDVLNYSCKYGNDDPACQSAKELREFINSKIKHQ